MAVEGALSSGGAMPRRSYHHGDLRHALVVAAVELLETTSASALSLREVARKAGVTTGAPYHHFPSKADLLVEVACLGFAALGEELLAVDASHASPEARLATRIERYVRFALDHGAHYRVMFAPELRESRELPRYELVARRGFDALVEAVAAVRPDAAASEARALARTVWAGAHGFVLLTLDGTLGALEGERGESARIRATAEHLVGLVTAR